jgi:hypothetical protein
VNFGQYRREIKTTPKRRTNEVSILEVEAVQLVASLLRVGYVFIDNEGGALGVVGDTLSNLATKDRQYKIRQAHLDSARQHCCDQERSSSFRGYAYRMGPNFPKRSNNSSGVTL